MGNCMKICNSCIDFDFVNSVCTIRYLIHDDGSRKFMPRKPLQKGCNVFMLKLKDGK